MTVSVQTELSLCFLKQDHGAECSAASIPVNSHYPLLCQAFRNNENTCFRGNSAIIFFLDIFINITDYSTQLNKSFSIFLES